MSDGLLVEMDQMIHDSNIDEVNRLLGEARDAGLSMEENAVLQKAEEVHHCTERLMMARNTWNAKEMDEALGELEVLGIQNKYTQECHELVARLHHANELIAKALQFYDYEDLKQASVEAEALNLQNIDSLKVNVILNSASMEKLAKLQLKAATEAKDPIRIALATIRVKDLFFESSGHLFDFRHFAGLRPPTEFGVSRKYAGSHETAASEMCRHTGTPIRGPLTRDCLSMSKDAKLMFKAIMNYMGDYVDPKHSALESAHALVAKGIESPTLATEIYCQLMKQLCYCPSEAQSQKGWELMGLCLDTFLPGPALENYLERWIRSNADDVSVYLSILHTTAYEGPKTEVPSDEQIMDLLEGRFKQPILEAKSIVQFREEIEPSSKRAKGFEVSIDAPQEVEEPSPSDGLRPPPTFLAAPRQSIVKRRSQMFKTPLLMDKLRLWKQETDPETGLPFYFHVVTNETRWDNPNKKATKGLMTYSSHFDGPGYDEGSDSSSDSD